MAKHDTHVDIDTTGGRAVHERRVPDAVLQRPAPADIHHPRKGESCSSAAETEQWGSGASHIFLPRGVSNFYSYGVPWRENVLKSVLAGADRRNQADAARARDPRQRALREPCSSLCG